jgi:HAD superfamily hydrolase (TIGR01509 family)
MSERTSKAVTFDAGQTLVELDTAMLSRRLAERGVHADAAALDAAQPPAWRRYEQVVKDGGHEEPWQIFMRTLLEGAGVPAAAAAELAVWLWTEQPAKNLWRRPIPGMFELAAELTARGVPVGILSNSEGKLAELVDEIGWRAPFAVIVDSGKLGVAKPERAIFEHAARALGVTPAEVVHIGDSRTADVDGGRAAGMRTIWFGAAARERPDDGDDVAVARDATAVRAALVRWGLA